MKRIMVIAFIVALGAGLAGRPESNPTNSATARPDGGTKPRCWDVCLASCWCD